MYDEVIHLKKIGWGWTWNDKWWFATEVALTTAYPVWQNWWYAVIWETDSIRIRDWDTNNWIDGWIKSTEYRENDWLTHIKPKDSKKVNIEYIDWVVTDEYWELTLEPTGFTNSWDIIVTYNSTDRTITLNWTFEAYYKWKKVVELVDGWVSPPHANATWTYFLHYCDWSFKFDTTPRVFDCLQIAFVQKNSHNMAIRETHWFMPWQSHKEFHETIWTYRSSGGDISWFTLNSITPANRRPDIAQLVVYDEDLKDTIKLLNTKKYTQRYLLWPSGTRTLEIQQNDIIKMNGNVARYNFFNWTEWTFGDIPNNQYAAIFIVWVPTTNDIESQEYRYMRVQPQQFGSLQTIQWLTPVNLTHWDSMMFVSEFVFFGKIIIQTTGNNRQIYSAEILTGTRNNQVASPSWNYLSVVNTDNSLQWNWTPANPLKLSDKLDILTERKFAYDTKYKEFSYTDGYLTQVDVWEDNTKTNKLFTQILTYTGGYLTQDIIADEISMLSLQRDYIYTNGYLTNQILEFYSLI